MRTPRRLVALLASGLCCVAAGCGGGQSIGAVWGRFQQIARTGGPDAGDKFCRAVATPYFRDTEQRDGGCSRLSRSELFQGGTRVGSLTDVRVSQDVAKARYTATIGHRELPGEAGFEQVGGDWKVSGLVVKGRLLP